MKEKFIGSRFITWDEIRERLEKPMNLVAFETEFDLDDYAMEDTLMVPIAMPRVAWKLLYGSAKSAGMSVGEVASEWLCDTATDMIENMRPLRNKIVDDAQEGRL